MEFNESNVIVSGSRSSLSEYANYTTVYPKPAMVGGKIVLTQEMVSKPNVKYVIKWNFDLNGATVTIPASCLIEFDGGAISNGTLVGQSTILIYNQPLNDILTATLEGTWRHESGVKADEEDITDLNGELKFKDKAYAPANYSGLGRKILRKNIVNGVNTLTQSMINQPNTIYIIQYDFTLGEDITVPDNCVLEFEGGNLSNSNGNNYKITCTNTFIESSFKPIFINCVLFGTILNNFLYSFWFNTKGDGNTEDYSAINNFITSASNVNKGIYFNKPSNYYRVNTPITISNIANIIFEDYSYSGYIRCDANSSIPSGTYLMTIVPRSGMRIENLSLGGNGASCNGLYINANTGLFNVNSIRIYNFDGAGLTINNVYDSVFTNTSVELCGNADNYAFSVIGSNNDTSNVTIFNRLQIEQAKYKIWYAKSLLNVTFNNVHIERATIVEQSDYDNIYIDGIFTITDGRWSIPNSKVKIIGAENASVNNIRIEYVCNITVRSSVRNYKGCILNNISGRDCNIHISNTLSDVIIDSCVVKHIGCSYGEGKEKIINSHILGEIDLKTPGKPFIVIGTQFYFNEGNNVIYTANPGTPIFVGCIGLRESQSGVAKHSVCTDYQGNFITD